MKIYLAVTGTKLKASDSRFSYISDPFQLQAEDDKSAREIATAIAVEKKLVLAAHFEEGLAAVRVMPFQ